MNISKLKLSRGKGTVFYLGLMLFLFLFSSASFADNINWQVTDQGGSPGSSTNYRLLDASGQGAVGTGSSGANYNLSAGYIPPLFAPAPAADLTLTKSSDPAGDTNCASQIFKGDTIAYTLKYECSGDTAVNVRLIDYLDPGVDLVDTGTATYDGAARTLTWSLNDLSPGDSAALTFTCQVTADSGACIKNYAQISANNVDTVTSDTITHSVKECDVAANAGSDDIICAGTCAILGDSPTATGGTPPYTYLWTPGAGLSSDTAANPQACPDTTTTYTLTVTDSNDLTDTDQVVVTVLTAEEDLKGVIVYPNPFKPGHSEINFAHLTAEATIKIFDIAGELVRKIEEQDGDGRAVWDGKNGRGKKVASGIYIYLITAPGSQKCVGKIGIVR